MKREDLIRLSLTQAMRSDYGLRYEDAAKQERNNTQDSDEVKTLARELFVNSKMEAKKCWEKAREFYRAGDES